MADLAWFRELFGPSERAEPIDWDDVHRTLGLEFPEPYRELMDAYPSLCIDEYLLLLHPLRPAVRGLVENWDFYLQKQALFGGPRRIEEFDPATGETRETDRRYPCYPEPGGLFPWGETDYQVLCWLTDPDPDKWTVVVCDYVAHWRYMGGVTDFLADALSYRLKCPLFAADWPNPSRPFEIIQFPED